MGLLSEALCFYTTQPQTHIHTQFNARQGRTIPTLVGLSLVSVSIFFFFGRLVWEWGKETQTMNKTTKAKKREGNQGRNQGLAFRSRESLWTKSTYAI